jgi:short-subunit dehydrogenase
MDSQEARKGGGNPQAGGRPSGGAMEPKVVVVTGASSGIGAELARQLARQGHRLVLAARTREKLEAVARECGAGALAVTADVTKRADVERIRDEGIRRFGHVDAWVNNAGQGINKPVLDLTDEDLDAMIDVNLRSVLHGMQAIVPHFQQRGKGHLVNVSSFLGRVPLAPQRSAYNAAKAGVNALTANLRMDLRERWPGIHVSLVMPGIVATEFPTSVRGGGGQAWTPGQRVGPQVVQSSEEVARMIADLLEHPQAELYTNPSSHETAQRYFADVAAFEARASGSAPAGSSAGASVPHRGP